MSLNLNGKQVLAGKVHANIVWDDQGTLTGASLQFENFLLSPELRALGMADPTLPTTSLHTGMEGLNPALVEAWRAATIALYEDALNFSQIQGVTKA